VDTLDFWFLVLSRARSAMRKISGFAVHFRFLNSIIASFSAMYSKPALGFTYVFGTA
jgi:hypothetical protein